MIKDNCVYCCYCRNCCKNCIDKGDKWYMLQHNCKMNKSIFENTTIKNIYNYQELLRQLIFETIVNSNKITDHKKLLEGIDYDIQNIEEVDLAYIKWT